MDYFTAPDRLDTPEFTVRSYETGDGRLLAQAIRDSYEHLRTFMFWAKPDYSDEEGEHFCRTSRAHYLLADNFTLGIFSPNGSRILGGTGFHLHDGGVSDATAEIGMWIHVDAAGHGLGTRALMSLLSWGFDCWPWIRLFWRCDTRNLASARVAEKAGMQKEGIARSHSYLTDGTTRRDLIIFAAIRDEWLAQHGKS